MATFVDLCKAVRAQAGISGDGPSQVAGQSGIYSDVVRWVEESYNEIQTLHDNWNFLFQVSSYTAQAGQTPFNAKLNLALRQIDKQSFVATKQVTDKTRLKFIPYAIYKNSTKFLEEKSGKPKHITEDPSGLLILIPTPDEDYVISFGSYIEPHVMVDNLDTPLIKSQYHDLIKLKALMKYSEYFSVPELYKTADRNFSLMLTKMQYSELPRDNLTTPTLVPFV